LGNVLVWVGGIGALVVGLVLGLGLYDQGLAAAGFATGAAGLTLGLILIPFLALIVAGSLMLGGREQVEAAEEDAGHSHAR
jgi:energy-coupling factor transport system substrate-specific component